MRALLVMLALGGCGNGDYRKPTEPRAAWLYDRGATSFATCVRMASAMRAECGNVPACEHAVSEYFSYDCYAGSYRGTKAQWTPCDEKLDVARTCREAIGAGPLAPHCTAELRYFADFLCRTGDPTLTGAGP
jgi:hypothetical protein